jgi:hypothetical protein
MHRIDEVVSRTVRGYADLFLRPSPYFWKQVGIEAPLLYYVYLFGLARILFSPARVLLAIPLVTINFLAFLVPLGVDARLVGHSAPFVCFVVAYGLWLAAYYLRCGVEAVWKRVRPAGDRKDQA